MDIGEFSEKSNKSNKFCKVGGGGRELPTLD